jgi:hypothetical protein
MNESLRDVLESPNSILQFGLKLSRGDGIE